MTNILICTVGTSLLRNLRHLPAENALKRASEAENWIEVSLLMLKLEGNDKTCGAEINSITKICAKGVLDKRRKLVLLVSDTEQGRKIGQLLKLYYEQTKNPYAFTEVELKVLEGLSDKNIKDFQQKGLKSLVREISTEARKFGAENIAINATGGYKAQISFAGMIGQALNIPIYYLFENFSDIIELLPQPIALDLQLWLNNATVFEQLEEDATLLKSELEIDLDEAILSSLLDEEEIDGEVYISLSAMGSLFNERSRLYFPKQEIAILSLVPKTDLAPEDKKIALRDEHGKNILEAFSEKIIRSPYVKEIINSLPFNPQRINPIRRTFPDGKIEFILTWTDEGYGLSIQTTGHNLAQTKAIALHLENNYLN